MVTDKISKLQFLVNTGAEISVVAPNSSEKNFKSDLKLYAANSSIIDTFGKKLMNLDVGFRRSFPWNFTIANLNRCI